MNSKNSGPGSEETEELDRENMKGNNTKVNNTNDNTNLNMINGIKCSNVRFYSNLTDKRFCNNVSKIDRILDSISSNNKLEYKKVLTYYLRKYSEVMEEDHPEIKLEHWERVINDLFIEPVCELSEGEPDYYYGMIDRHFLTLYQDCDYNILNFATEKILENRFHEACY
jgi:hypothetical protein